MTHKKFRYYQNDANLAICQELEVADKCLVKMFCGTGKSLVMANCSVLVDESLVVYVMPSLALIRQFCSDYLSKKKQVLTNEYIFCC